MKLLIGLTAALSLAACATQDYVAQTDQCAHSPGCTTIHRAPLSGPPHAQAVAPVGPN